MKTILALLAIFVAMLQYELWFSHGGLLSAFQLHHKINQQQQLYQRLAAGNQEILADINDLRHNREAIEAHARYDLGMIKQGEVFYQLEQ